MRMLTLAAAAALATISTAALATVTGGPDTGWFVGKGDVQSALGWNNNDAQTKSVGLTFTYKMDASFHVTCYWTNETGQGRIIEHEVTVPKNFNVNKTIVYDARTHKQIDGYWLDAISLPDHFTPPVVGGACPNGGDGIITDVQEDGDAVIGLFVNYGVKSVQIG